MDEFALTGRVYPKRDHTRPLHGVTILVVEDSRFASEGFRLLCLRSGARIRRADCLASARRHLQVYRPAVIIVDVGLPDGNGLDLIADLRARPDDGAMPVFIATSADDHKAAALDAGADDFLAKPCNGLGQFQSMILSRLPRTVAQTGPVLCHGGDIAPDLFAYRQDLTHALDLLDQPVPPLPYLRPFLIGVARAAGDARLETEVTATTPANHAALRASLQARLAAQGALI